MNKLNPFSVAYNKGVEAGYAGGYGQGNIHGFVRGIIVGFTMLACAVTFIVRYVEPLCK